MTTKISQLPANQQIAWSAGAAATASTPLLNLTQTWNNVATTFMAILLRVTDTTSAAASLLMDLGTAGAGSVFSVRKDGVVISASDIRSGAALQADSGSAIGWLSRALLKSPADGVFIAIKNAGGQLTVATLPSAATVGAGARAFVTDATAPTFGATVAGAGAVNTPVYSDGTNWKVG